MVVNESACALTENGDHGGLKMILNGPQREGWTFPNSSYFTLNAPTAIDRVQLRPTKEIIKQIYAVSL